MNRTQEEIVQRIKEVMEYDFLGIQAGDLIDYLDYDHAKEYLREDVTREQWEKISEERLTPAAEIEKYMEFAWNKANSCRGLSAARSLNHMCSWLWLDGEDELAKQILNYSHYGKPELVAICEKYGIEWAKYDNGEWVNNEDDTPKTAEEVLNDMR